MVVTSNRTRTSRLVLDWVIGQIRSGELRPGDRIPTESELCALLGVGRSSVREAIQSLVAANMLVIRRGQGTYVQAVAPEAVLDAADLPRLLRPHGVLDLIEFREILETGVVALACARATPDDLAAMRRALEANESAVEVGRSAVDADEQFHHTLVEAAHNPVVLQALRSLSDLLRHSRETTNRIPGSNARAYQSHLRIYQAVEARDAERAQQAMLDHLDALRREIVRQAQDIARQAEERRDGIAVRKWDTAELQARRSFPETITTGHSS